jgi:hypothetical protein
MNGKDNEIAFKANGNKIESFAEDKDDEYNFDDDKMLFK